MPKVRMTVEWLRRPPAGEWGDLEHPGLWLRVRDGRRTWTLRYSWEGAERRLKLGRFTDEFGLAAARKAARQQQAEIDAGRDPQAARRSARVARAERRAGQTVASAVRAWLKDKQGPAARWKGGVGRGGGAARATMPHVRRLVRELGPRLLVDLAPEHVEAFVSAPLSAGTRNHARTAITGLLRWARRKRLIARDHWTGLTEDVVRERANVRKRVLGDEEIVRLVRGYDATRYGRAVRLLFLTGLRREEVMGLRWEWLDLEAGAVTFPAEVDKSAGTRGETYRAALSGAAVQLLRDQRAALFADGLRSSPWCFPTSAPARGRRTR
jgi:integrase